MRRRRFLESEGREERMLSLPKLDLADVQSVARLGVAACGLYYYAEPDDPNRYEMEIFKADMGVLGGVEGYDLNWFEGLVDDIIRQGETEDESYNLSRYYGQVAAWLEGHELSDERERLLAIREKLASAWRRSLDRVKREEFPGEVVDFVSETKPADAADLLERALLTARELLPREASLLARWYPSREVVRNLEDMTHEGAYESEMVYFNNMSKFGRLVEKAQTAIKLGGDSGWCEVRDCLAVYFESMNIEELAYLDSSLFSYFKNSILASDWEPERKVAALTKMAGAARLIREKELALIKATPERPFDTRRKPSGGDEVMTDAIRGLISLNEPTVARSLYWYWPWCDASDVLQVGGDVMELIKTGVPGMELWLEEAKTTFRRLSEEEFDDYERFTQRWDREEFWADYGLTRRGRGFFMDKHAARIKRGQYSDLVDMVLTACEQYPQENSRVMGAIYVEVIHWIELHRQGKLELSDIRRMCEVIFTLMRQMGDGFFETELYKYYQENLAV